MWTPRIRGTLFCAASRPERVFGAGALVACDGVCVARAWDRASFTLQCGVYSCGACARLAVCGADLSMDGDEEVGVRGGAVDVRRASVFDEGWEQLCFARVSLNDDSER